MQPWRKPLRDSIPTYTEQWAIQNKCHWNHNEICGIILSYGVDPKTIMWIQTQPWCFVYTAENPRNGWQTNMAFVVSRDYTTKELANHVYRAMMY
jgi:hypothetical protein